MPTPSQTLLLSRPVSFGTLITSGNEITDYVRSLPDQGDGLTNDGSFGVWPAATNRAINSNAKTNTTSIIDVGATTSRVASGLVGGDTTHFSTVTANAATDEGTSQLISGGLASTQYTFSVFLAGSGTVKLYIYDTIGGKQLGSQITLTATPTKYSVTATTGALGITETCGWETDSQQAITVTHGRWMCQTGAAPTPHVLTDGGTATSSAGRMRIPTAGLFTPTQGWFAIRTRIGLGNAAAVVSNYPALFGFGNTDFAEDMRLGFSDVGVYWEQTHAAAQDVIRPATTYVTNELYTLIVTWSATLMKLSINGAVFLSVARAGGVVTFTGTTAEIGSMVGPNRTYRGDSLWAAIGAGLLTNSDAAAIHALGNAGPPRFSALPSGSNPTAIADFKTGSFQRRKAA